MRAEGSGMSPATRTLHEQVIRLLKGMVQAYETWLKAQP